MDFRGTGLGFNTLSTITTTAVTTTSVTADQVLYSFSGATYRSAKIIVQGVDSTSSKYHTCEILIVHNGTVANYTEYASVDAGGVVATFNADYNSGNVRLLVTPASANSTVFKLNITLTAI